MIRIASFVATTIHVLESSRSRVSILPDSFLRNQKLIIIDEVRFSTP